MKRPGDWNCPACEDLQFARNTQCRKCGEPKPAGVEDPPASYTPPQREGDWFCCNDLQFGRNMYCRRCGGPRPAGAGNSDAEGAAPPMGNHPAQREGDWFCCNDLQFARNSNCRRCGAPKPYGGPQGGYGGGFGGGFGGGNNQAPRPGDWYCCNDLQFARNTNCRRCGAPKPYY